MTQENSPQGAGTPTGAGEVNASPHLDSTTLGALVNDLLVRVALLERRVGRLESENQRLKSQQAAAYDWSAEVPREMREVT